MNGNEKYLLQITGYQLFGGSKPEPEPSMAREILREAKIQTVFTTVFPFLKGQLRQTFPERWSAENMRFYNNAQLNAQNFTEHGELHALMTSSGVPYVALKGLASAYYYPQPALRDMGDVDFLVREEDFEKVRAAVASAGFKYDHGGDDGIHIAFRRPPKSVWEQHRSVNGIPGGEAGRLIRERLGDCITTAREVALDGAVCRIPDDFHHGLIMLLHVISHLTGEGIGLRHLCDWAVFTAKLGDDEFTELFERELKAFGLWRFARLLTSVGVKYLGAPERKWAAGAADDGFLEEMMSDILNGGNFGRKDKNREREIKYISNRGERTVDNKNVFAQAVSTLNAKTRADYKWIDRHRAFLPCGWVAEGGKYLGLLLSGKRKTSGTSAMLKEASQRKTLYSGMKLFEIE